MKKFELTGEQKCSYGKILFRIKALKPFGNVVAGQTGGWVEKEENLSQEDNAWVSDDAVVKDNAVVSGDAVVEGDTVVSDDAVIKGNAIVGDNAVVSGDTIVGGNARVIGNALVSDDAVVKDNAVVSGDAIVKGNAAVSGNARVIGDAVVGGNARVIGNAWIKDGAVIKGNAVVSGDADYALIRGFGTAFRTTTFFRCYDDKIRVSCGCFFGTISEFREQVKKTRSGKIVEEYLAIADLMEKHFEKEENHG